MKLTLIHRIFMITVVFSLLLLSTVGTHNAFSQVVEPKPMATDEIPTAVIDLSIDENLDDIPDQLLAAIERFEAVYTEVSQREGDIQKDPEALAILQKASDEYVGSLPFDDSIREMQKRMAELHNGLADAPDDETRQKMRAEMEVLDWQLLQDSNYSLVAQILSRRLLTALQAKDPQKNAPADGATVPSKTSDPLALTLSLSHSVEGARSLAPSAMNAGGATVDMPAIWSQLTLDPCSNTTAPNYNLQAKGEIMFYQASEVKNFVYAKKWSHIGIYNGLNSFGQPSVYESNASGGTAGAVRVNLRTTWSQLIGSCVAFCHCYGYNGRPTGSRG